MKMIPIPLPMKDTLPTRKEWKEAGFTGLPDDLCSPEKLPTPLEVVQPLIDKISEVSVPQLPKIEPLTTPLARISNVEPPIARQEHIQSMIRRLRQDRDMYRKLLGDTEKLITDYECMSGLPL